MKTNRLKLSEIVTTAGTQIRARLDHDTVDEYATAMKDAANEFPPVVVFHDGNQYILADGFHRVMAASRDGVKDISAEVRKGAKSDALKYALGANSAHGLKRSNADKRRSVELALEEWPKWSDNELSKVCAVSHPFVGEVRRSLQPVTVTSSKPETRIGRDGKERKLPAKKPAALATPIIPTSNVLIYKTREECKAAIASTWEDPRTQVQQEEAVFTKLATAIKEQEKEEPVTLKTLQIRFKESMQPDWLKADRKVKKEFLSWLKG